MSPCESAEAAHLADRHRYVVRCLDYRARLHVEQTGRGVDVHPARVDLRIGIESYGILARRDYLRRIENGAGFHGNG